MKNIIIINTYPNSDEKLNVLNNHLKQLKKTGYDILLTSHLPIPEYILKHVTYFIYDKENFLLPRDRMPITWFADENDYISIYSCNHGYTIIKNLFLAINFLDSLNLYDNFIFTEYDNVLSDNDVLKTQNIIDILEKEKKKLFIFKLSNQKFNFGCVLYQTSNFAGNIKFFKDNVKLVRSFDEWCTTPPYDNTNELLEYIFVQLLSHISDDDIYFFDGEAKEYFDTSEIDLFHTFDYKYNIAYNLTDKSNPVIFILSRGAKYEIIINNKTIYSKYAKKNEWIKEFFHIDDSDTKVIIKVDDKEVYSIVLNLDNIEKQKQFAERGSVK